MAAALLSLIRLRQVRWTTVRDGIFLVGLAAMFIFQLIAGLSVARQPDDSGTVDAIAILVIVSFIVGISRAWELIGGPSIGIGHEVAAMVRHGETASAGSSASAGNSGSAGSSDRARAQTARRAQAARRAQPAPEPGSPRARTREDAPPA